MKRLFMTTLATLFLFSLLPSALAVEESADTDIDQIQEVVSVETEETEKSVVVNVNLPAAVESEPVAEFNVVNDPTPEIIPYSVTALDDTSEAGSALVDAVKELFGEYQPRTQTVVEHLADGSTVTYQEVVPGLAGLDWSWLAGVVLFALFLYGLLRLLGGLIKL